LLKRDGKPDRQLKQYEALQLVLNDPVNGYLRAGQVPGSISVDRWGTTIAFPKDAPGKTPHITEENKVLKDITHWRDVVHAPDLIANCSEGWEAARKTADEIRANGKLATTLMGTGIFEQCHFLMGFEDTLTNLYEHPQEMHELIDYIFEYRMTFVKLICENLHPDVILSHDDWGTKHALFMQPDTWREFFKEPYRKFYSYIRSQGIVAIHHADSYCAPIVEDMVDIGIQIWQGALPENDIPKLLEQLDGRMVLMGGIGAAIDRADTTEEEARTYVRQVLHDCCPYGHFIPCITYGAPGTVFKHVDPFINAEIDAYNQILHLPDYRSAKPIRRSSEPVKTKSAVQETTKESELSTLEQISLGVQKGQKNRVLKLCQQALGEGTSAHEILSDGLVAGMAKLGEDFSANKVFVPEMLIAAKCMSAATDALKSELAGPGSESIGTVCLGTVKGDMHDIGKNLVKIMMEGSGLTVIDLGTDVSAETFIQTVKEKHCDIIVCSSLLTTTMSEMRNVVNLAVSEGIRDNVTIMIGGAPISQQYCDDIKADIYTEDAASAARAAVEALTC
jgi:methanogenic corrinoid protein MtbC1/uroporphyrinogen-III decarboxylase